MCPALPRPHPVRSGAFVRRWLLAALFAVTGHVPLGWSSAQAGAPVGAQELLDARVTLARAFDPLVRAGERLDPAGFDLDALGLELAFEDAEAIVAEVHRRVRLEPYLGVLRGAHGALSGGAGNPLDQALLVATLLGLGGYEVEIRGATLSDEAVALVLAQLRPAGPDGAQEAIGPVAPVDAEVEAWAALPALEAQAERAIDGFLADVERAVDALEVALALGAGATPLEEAARSYHWVAYRFHDGEPWTEAHPVFGAAPPLLTGLEAEEVFVGEVPAAWQHRFRFQAFVERRLGDRLEVVALTDAWERPVANLIGVPLSYANVPDGLGAAGPGADAEAVRAATNFFFPMWNGDVAPGAQAFDLMGATVPPEAAASPFAALFQTTARSLAGAAGALGGLGSATGPVAEPIALTAQWLEFTLIAPGGAESVHRRMVVDRLGGEARAAASGGGALALDEAAAFAHLQSVHTILLDPGAYGPDYRTSRSIESVLAVRDLADAALVAAAEGRPAPAVDPTAARLEEVLAGLTLFGTFAEAPLEADLRSYRPAPAVVVLSQGLDGTEAAVDVVANPRWTIRVGAEGPRLEPRANLRAGAWETRTEGLVLTRAGAVRSPSFEVLTAPTSGGLRQLGPADRSAVDGLPLPPEARAAIHDDLDRGYVVLAPATWDGRLETVGWWRVDPATGEALGRGADGRGNAFVEYLTSFEVSITITAGFAVYGAHQCSQIADARTAGCCLVQNVVLAGVGTAVGVGLGIAYTTTKAAMIIFGALDVGYNVAGVYLPTFCPGG